MKNTILLSILFTTFLGYAQVDIANQEFFPPDNMVIEEEFQLFSNDSLRFSWIYLKPNDDKGITSIAKEKNGYVYMSTNSEYFIKKGISIYPKKKEKVIYKKLTTEFLGFPFAGNLIELKSRKRSRFYLALVGDVNSETIGIQITIDKKITQEQNFPKTLNQIFKSINYTN